MAKRRLSLIWGMGALALACGDPSGSDGSGAGTNATTAPPNDTGDDSPGTTAATSAATSECMTSGNDGTTTTGVDADTTPPADNTTEPPVYFDLGMIPDSPMFCTEGDGDVQFSYIWIFNSTQ